MEMKYFLTVLKKQQEIFSFKKQTVAEGMLRL
jgi:hypothetical protein